MAARTLAEPLSKVLGGQIQMALIPPGIALPQIRAGKLNAIGLSSGRSALAPEIASLADAEIRNFNLEVWTALVEQFLARVSVTDDC